MAVRILALSLLLGVQAAAWAQADSAPAPTDALSSKSGETAPTSAPPETLSQDQIKDLIRRVAENDMANDKKLRDYTYTEREETKKLNKKGEVSST